MKKYEYKKEVKEDIENYLNEMDPEDWKELDSKTDEEIETDLYYQMWIADDVTGNGSGSYTFNTETAAEYLADNLDLLAKACDAFGESLDEYKEYTPYGPRFKYEAADIAIRCYLLPECLSEVLPEYLEKKREEQEEEEDPDPFAFGDYFDFDSEQEEENREMLEA